MIPNVTPHTLQTYHSIHSPPQILENGRNQLEARDLQLQASKEQLVMMTTTIENKDREITELKEQIKGMEKRLAGSLKGLLLWSDEKELAASHKVDCQAN